MQALSSLRLYVQSMPGGTFDQLSDFPWVRQHRHVTGLDRLRRRVDRLCHHRFEFGRNGTIIGGTIAFMVPADWPALGAKAAI